MILKSVSEGIKFILSLKTTIPYFLLHLLTFYSLIGFFSILINITSSNMGILGRLFSLGIYLPLFILIGLAYLWVNGAIIDQAKNYPRRKSLTKSFKYSTSKYLTILCAAILYVILTAIFSSLPYIGSILSFILSLFLFFLYPVIIVDNKGCLDSFKKSINTFLKFPLETFVTWLLMSIIGFIIVGIFAIPLISLFLGKIVETLANSTASPMNVNGSQPFLNSLASVFMSSFHSPFFILSLVILCIGFAISSAFQIGTQTRLYINTRKSEI